MVYNRGSHVSAVDFHFLKLKKNKLKNEISENLWVVYIEGSHVAAVDFHFFKLKKYQI